MAGYMKCRKVVLTGSAVDVLIPQIAWLPSFRTSETMFKSAIGALRSASEAALKPSDASCRSFPSSIKRLQVLETAAGCEYNFQ